MRLFLATTVLIGVVLIGLVSSRTSAQGQNLQAGITSGETLSLWFDADRTGHDCTVIDVRGDFVGCRGGSAQVSTETWYNLRLIKRIDRSARQ
jgi:hypothetical protein